MCRRWPPWIHPASTHPLVCDASNADHDEPRRSRRVDEVGGYHFPGNRAFRFSGTLLKWTRYGDDHDRPRIRLPLECLFPEWGDDLRTLLLNTALPGCSDRLSAVR
jgi:hypothetical protein